MADDEELPLDPPPAARVHRRALILAASVCRADIGNDPAGEEFRQDVLAWLTETEIASELEPEERDVLETPAGKLSRQAVIDCSWRSEALAVLAWALGAIDLPPYDEPVAGASEIATKLGFLADDIGASVERAALRPHAEIEQFGERMFALHWRLRQFSLDQQPIDFAKVAKEAWFGPLDTTGLRFIDNDLAIGNEPLARAANWQEALSIARERHQAANWLLGHETVYSMVTADT